MKKLFALLLAAMPVAAQVTVSQVNDRRTSGSFSHLMITLELPKVKSGDVAAARVLVSNAVDNSGRSVVDPSEQDPQLEPNRRGAMGGDDAAAEPLTVSLTLKNPERKATALKEVRGEIELYMPSRDANSLAEVPKFLSTSGKPIAHKALKANGVEISLVSPAQLAAEKKRLGDAKRKEYKDAGYDNDADIDSMVASYTESLIRADENDVVARIKDPTKRIQEISYVDAAGDVKRVSTSDSEGFTILSTWSGKPQPDWKLRVSMKTPKNLVRMPFTLTNVALP